MIVLSTKDVKDKVVEKCADPDSRKEVVKNSGLLGLAGTMFAIGVPILQSGDYVVGGGAIALGLASLAIREFLKES